MCEYARIKLYDFNSMESEENRERRDSVEEADQERKDGRRSDPRREASPDD